MTDTGLPHDKMSLTRISELGREREQKLEEQRGREQAQLEQAQATTLRRLRDGHLVELEKAYDLSDGATISCRISDGACWFGRDDRPAMPSSYQLVINIPGHKDVYRAFHLKDDDYVRSGQWCVDHQRENPHHTLQDALVRARESQLRDEANVILAKRHNRRLSTRGRFLDWSVSVCDKCIAAITKAKGE